ncbi:MAG: IS110 family transposase [Verrucomicrobiota bacterium]
MNEYIAFDSHKHYTLMERQNAQTGRTVQLRLAHQRGALCAGLRECSVGTAVAVEATGNWYWIVGEIEQAGLRPLLVHPRKAKLMMGLINKTDALDVHGLNRLQQNGTLPTVWIPPAPLRDLRELTRTRLVLVVSRTKLKNRLQATLAKHGLSIAASDPFGVRARAQWTQHLAALPEQTRFVTGQLLQQLDFLHHQIESQEARLQELLQVTPAMQRLTSLPGFGLILATTVALEIGDINRFATCEHLASYAGTTPRVHSSGDKTRYGRLRADVNRYLKWAYIEAANVVSLKQKPWAARHVAQLYQRIRQRRGHAKAVGAVARHLAEASFWVLRRDEDYHEPARPGKEVSQPGSSASTA